MTAFLRDDPEPDEDADPGRPVGNLCRCTGYQGILAAVHEVVAAVGARPSPPDPNPRRPPMETIHHWIGGRAVDGPPGRTAPVYDPARGVQVAEVALAPASLVGDALKTAKEAAAAWGESSLTRRVAAMFELRELLHRHRDELAALVTREHGKVRADALGEVARGLECVEFACGIPSC